MSYYEEWNPYTAPQDEQPKKKEKKPRFFLKVVVGALIFGLVAGGTAFGTYRLGAKLLPEGGDIAKVTPEELTVGSRVAGTAVSSAVAVNDVSDIVENVMPAIVQVTNVTVVEYRGFFGQVYEQERPSAGSGVIIGEDEDYVYIGTNDHVISNSREITITFSDNEAVEASLQGTYPDKDVAVVKVKKDSMKSDTLSAIKIASLADSDSIKVGSASVVIGNALGYGLSVTTGVISALDREVSVANETTGQRMTNRLIQTDAAVNGGNSGGALLNMNGEVIGIVSAKYAATGVEGMGFAIPINEAREIIDSIISTGEYEKSGDSSGGQTAQNKAYLGIYGGMDIDDETSAKYNMPTGVYVSQVVKGQAADKAGIQNGDVIRMVDNVSISSMEGLQKALSVYNPGDEVRITVAVAKDNYRDSFVIVTLGSRSDNN